MKVTLLLLIAAVAVFSNACERHPLDQPYGTDPHPAIHEEHVAEKHEAKTLEHTEVAKPADGAKAEEAPKFFPEKK